MNAKLNVLSEGRGRSAAFILCALLGQALALGLAAVATRDAFAALRSGGAALLEPTILLVLAAGGVALLQFLARVEAERLGYAFARSLRTALFAQYARMPMSEISKRRLGALSLRFVGDLTAARGWAGTGMTRAAAAMIILPAAAFSLWLLNPALAVAATPPIAASLIAMIAIGWRQEQRHRGLRQQRARIATSMMERVVMAPQLDLLGRTENEIATLEAKNAELEVLAVRRIKPSTLMRLSPDIGVALAGALMFLTAAKSGVSSPDVAGALAALAILGRPLRDLAGAWDKFCAWRVARAKCQSILSARTMTRRRNEKPRPAALRVEDLKIGDAPSLTFETKYSGVHHLNRPANAELMDVISTLDESPSGRVLFLNQNGGVRLPRIALITGRAPIIGGSLRRALTLGAAGRPSDQIIERKAALFGFDETMSRLGGLDGRIREHGDGLDAGEVLRLLLTRAALTSPNFILVDAELLARETGATQMITDLNACQKTTILIVGDDIASPNWINVTALAPVELEKRIA